MSSATLQSPDLHFDDPSIKAAFDQLQPALKQLCCLPDKQFVDIQIPILDDIQPISGPLPDVFNTQKTAPNYPPLLHLGYRVSRADALQYWFNFFPHLDRAEVQASFAKDPRSALVNLIEWVDHNRSLDWETEFGCKKTKRIRCVLAWPGPYEPDIWVVSIIDSWKWSSASPNERAAMEDDIQHVKRILGQVEEPQWYLDQRAFWWLQPKELAVRRRQRLERLACLARLARR